MYLRILLALKCLVKSVILPLKFEFVKQSWQIFALWPNTVVLGYRVLGFRALPGIRAHNPGDGPWLVHKTLRPAAHFFCMKRKRNFEKKEKNITRAYSKGKKNSCHIKAAAWWKLHLPVTHLPEWRNLSYALDFKWWKEKDSYPQNCCSWNCPLPLGLVSPIQELANLRVLSSSFINFAYWQLHLTYKYR